jgi:hypothetical protein
MVVVIPIVTSLQAGFRRPQRQSRHGLYGGIASDAL